MSSSSFGLMATARGNSLKMKSLSVVNQSDVHRARENMVKDGYVELHGMGDRIVRAVDLAMQLVREDGAKIECIHTGARTYTLPMHMLFEDELDRIRPTINIIMRMPE